MASTITNFSNSININFPIPGQDNDSQGFRSNFSKIQSALSVAGDEITELQSNSVKLNNTNDFGNNILKKAALQSFSLVINDGGDITPDTYNIDFANGNYHKYRLMESGTYNFNFINWPLLEKSASIRLELLLNDEIEAVINLNATSSISRTTVNPVTYVGQEPIIWDIWSTDGGITRYAVEVGNRAVSITNDGNIYPTAVSTTTMTSGFFYIPSASGTPTETPTIIPGFVPMYYDNTNNKFYIYNGSWKKVDLT